MSMLLTVLDVAVLLLIVALLLRTIGNFGSPVLTGFVGLFVILFAIVSMGAYAGLLAVSSGVTQGIFLVIFLAMAFVVVSSWSTNTGKS